LPCRKKILKTVRVSMLMKSRTSPDMLPFRLYKKKRLAFRHMNSPLFPTTLSIPSYHQKVGRAKNLSAHPCIAILHPQNNRHFKWQPSVQLSQTLWRSSPRHLFSSFFLNRRIFSSPPISRDTLIYLHWNSHTVLKSRILLD
jgi:hypothetical protein